MRKFVNLSLSLSLTILIIGLPLATPFRVAGTPITAANTPLRATDDPPDLPLSEEAPVTQLFLHESVNDFAGIDAQGFGLPRQLNAEPKALAVAFARQQRAARSDDTDAQTEWQPTRVQADELGFTHVALTQHYDGLPVFASEMIVHVENGQSVHAANGEFPATINIETKPTLSAEEARKVAFSQFRPSTADAVNELTTIEEELLIFNPALVDAGAAVNHLAYRFLIGDTDPLAQQVIFVEAHSGKVLFRYDNVYEERNRHVYDMNFGWAPPGVQCYAETGPISGGSPPTECTNAFNFTGSTYDYFQQRHSRDSFDDRGSAMVALVNYGTEANAFWANNRAIFGPGFATKDVVAHEWTHAVTQHSANLVYANQSGALNESISDIFGAMVDRDDWLIGEDSTLGAFRSLADPNQFGHPGRVGDAQYFCGAHNSDNGGVHTNSSVPNHAAYLMAEGGSYNGRDMDAIGREATERIFYRALTSYLTSGSNFADAANGLTSACADLFGAETSTCATVQDALLATEMKATVCNGDDEILADAFEPDNAIASASTINADGAPQSHNFHRPDDSDWVKLEITANSDYLIETLNLGPGSDTVLSLYKADGTSLIAQNDDYDGQRASRVLWSASENGVIYIRVRHFSPTVYGAGVEYDLRVVSNRNAIGVDAYEGDNDAATASEITPDGPAQLQHNFHMVGDVDWVRFTADAAINYRIETFNLGAGNDTVMGLYSADGESLLAQNDDGGEEQSSLIEWTASAAGSYLLRIHRYASSVNTISVANSSYDLRVQTAPPLPKPDEPNDDVDLATVLQTDAPAHTGNFHRANDRDWYRFTATGGAGYVIETSALGSSSDTSITLFAADGSTELALDDDSGDGLASLIGWTAPTDGAYLVRVHHFSPATYGSNTQYDIAIHTMDQGENADTFEADDTPETASTIIVNAPAQTRTFHDVGDTDWVRFNAVVGVNYTIQTHDIGANNDTIIELFAPDAVTRLVVNDDSGADLGSRIDWFAPSSDEYFVRVRAYSGAFFGEEATYRFTITGIGDDSPDRYEDDDTPTAASSLTDTQTNHTFHDQNDPDWARFTAIAGVDYVFETRNLGRRTDTVLELFDTDGVTMLTENDDHGATLASRIEWSAPANGNYYVKARHFTGNTFGANTGYDLHFAEGSIGPDPYEPDDTAEQASAITTDGQPQAHRFDTVGDQDWVHFTAAADTIYVIETLNLGPAADTYLYLYAADGVTILAQNDDNGGGFASRINWTAAEAGSYYVMVRDFSGSSGSDSRYTLRIREGAPLPDAYEPDDSPSEAAEIGTDGILQRHTFHAPGDQDWVKFDAQTDVEYVIETLNLAQLGDTRLALYDRDGTTLLAENDDHGDTVASLIKWTAPANGIYYAKARHFTADSGGNQTGYDIRVIADSASNGGDSHEPDDLFSQASIITVDGPAQTHDFYVGGDQDWVAFQSAAGQQYRIETFNLGPSSDTILSLYGPDHTTLIAANDDYGSNLGSRIDWTAPDTDTYYIVVKHISQSIFGPDSHYSLAVTTDPTGAIAPSVSVTPRRHTVTVGDKIETVIRIEDAASLIKVESLAKPSYVRLIEIMPATHDPGAMTVRWQIEAQPVDGKLTIPLHVTVVNGEGAPRADVVNLAFVVNNGRPKVFDVSPPSFRNDTDTTLSVLGSNFQPTPKVYLIKAGESIQLNDVEFVDPEPGDPFLLAVVAAGTKPGRYKVSIKNPDGGEAVYNGIEVLNDTPAYEPRFSLSSSNRSGASGTDVTYEFQLTNRGVHADSFDLAVSDNRWPIGLSATLVSDLVPGGGVLLTVKVSVPDDAAIDATDTVVITAISQGDPSQHATAALLTTSTGPESPNSASMLYLPVIRK